MIYLKQVKLLDPDLVASGNPEELNTRIRLKPSFHGIIHFHQTRGYFPCRGKTGRENLPCWKL